jgi:hypothetical protein
VGTVPWDSPEYQGYALMSDGYVWHYDRGRLVSRIGTLPEFMAKIAEGKLRGAVLPGAAGNPPAKYRYNLHSKKERERLAGDLLAQQGMFRGAVAKGRFEEAHRILGWFQGVVAAAVASGAPPFYVGRLRVVARRLDRMLPEHPRRAAPPPEPWQNNRRGLRRNPVGTVEGLRYTRSGYQKTKIDGRWYATLFDLSEHPVAVGRRVEYAPTGKRADAYDMEYARIVRVLGNPARVARRAKCVGRKCRRNPMTPMEAARTVSCAESHFNAALSFLREGCPWHAAAELGAAIAHMNDIRALAARPQDVALADRLKAKYFRVQARVLATRRPTRTMGMQASLGGSRMRVNPEEDRNKDLGSIEWHKIPKGALVVEGEHYFTYHTTKGFYLVTWGSRDARKAQLHLKKMAREAWGKNPLTRREAADLLRQSKGHIERARRYRTAGQDRTADYALGRAQGKSSAVRQYGPAAARPAARKLLERQLLVNPHAGLTGLMNAREARRVTRFS